MPLAEQLVHQRYVHPGPLVLGTAPLKSPTPTADRDRTVKDAWNDFYFFEFTKANFMAQDVIYPGEGSMCA